MNTGVVYSQLQAITFHTVRCYVLITASRHMQNLQQYRATRENGNDSPPNVGFLSVPPKTKAFARSPCLSDRTK
jgi:hypothetical protein